MVMKAIDPALLERESKREPGDEDGDDYRDRARHQGQQDLALCDVCRRSGCGADHYSHERSLVVLGWIGHRPFPTEPVQVHEESVVVLTAGALSVPAPVSSPT